MDVPDIVYGISCSMPFPIHFRPVGVTDMPFNLENYVGFSEYLWDKHERQPAANLFTTQQYTDMHHVDSGSVHTP